MPRRVLVAKPGLDGHDRGAKVVARALRDAGYEVIYTGIRQKVGVIAELALQEDVDLVGLSVLSGAHLGLARQVLEALRADGLDDVKVVIGGTIPASNSRALLDPQAAEVPLFWVSVKELRQYLKDRRDPLTAYLAEKDGLSKDEAERRLAAW